MSKPNIKLPVMLMRARLVVVLALVVLGVFSAVNVFLPAKPASAATSSTLNFQARLLTSAGSLVPDGDYNIEFKLFNAASSSGSSQGSCSGDSNCLWTETRVAPNKVRVANGYLTVNLGSVNAFPAINWDQEMWLSMNIGGTGTVSWDGEMSPRLKLTAVPYAFRASQLAKNSGGNQATLDFTTPTANRSILLPDESGTICLQNASTCGFATSSGSGNYIQNQSGSDQTANFRITGTGRANTSFLTPNIDTAAAGTLSIGTATTTGITLGQASINTTNAGKFFSADSLYVGTTTVPGGVTNGRITSISSGTTNVAGVFRGASGQVVDLLQAQDSTGACLWRVSQAGTSGSCDTSSGASSSTSFRSGDTSAASSNSGAVTIRTGHSSNSGNTGTLNINTGNATSGNSGHISIDVGTASGTTGTIGIGNTNSSQINIGHTSGANSSVALLGQVTSRSTTDIANAFQVQNANSRRIFTVDTLNGQAMFGNVTATVGQGIAGKIVLADGTNDNFGLTISTGTLTANRSVVFGDEAGTVCLQNSSNCGFLTGGSVVQLQGSTPGSAQTGNFNITGTGIAGTLQAGTVTVNNASSVSALTVTNGSLSTLTVDTTNNRVGIGNASPTTDLDVGPGTMGASQVVQLRVGDFLIQSQQGAANGLTALTSRGSNGNLTLDGASGAALYLSPFSTNNSYLAAGGGSVRVGDQTVPAYKLDVVGDVNISSGSAYKINGTNICTASGCTATSGSGNYIQNTTSAQSANLYVQAATNGSVAGTLRANAAGTGDILDLLNGSGTAVATFGSAGAVLLKNSTNSTAAFQVQALNNNPVLTVDTTNERVGIGIVSPIAAKLHVATGSTTTIRGFQGGTSNLFELATSNNGAASDTNVHTVDYQGHALYQNIANSTTAFQIQNSLGTSNLLVADTTNTRIGIGKLPTTTLDVNGASTFTGALTQSGGVFSLQGNGASSLTTTSGGTLTITAAATSTWSTSGGDLTVQAATTNALNLQTGGAGTINVGINNTTAINVGNNSNIVRSISIGNTGGSQAQTVTIGNTGGSSSTTIQGGTGSTAINLNSGTNGSINLTANGTGKINFATNSSSGQFFFQSNTNSTTALQVKASGVFGATVLNIDTSNTRVGINNTSPSQALDVSGDINVGAFNNYRVNGTVVCNSSGCTPASGSSNYIQNNSGPLGQSANIYITSATGSATVARFQSPFGGTGDLLQLANGIGTVMTSVGAGGSALFKTTTNATTGFQVQNSSSVSQFTVDTSNSRIYVGPTAGSTTATLLLLGNKTNAGDPTGVEGAMYYNSSTNKFRCYEDGAWRSCLGFDADDNRQYPFISNDFLFDGNSGAVSFAPWEEGAASSGTMTDAPGETGHPGIITFSSSANTNSGWRIVSNTGAFATNILLSGGEAFETVVKPITTSNTTTRTGYLDSTASGDAEDGVYFEISGTTLKGKIANGFSRTDSASTYTITSGTWYRLKLVIASGASSATFYVYNSSGTQLWSSTATATVPTTAGGETGSGIISTRSSGGVAELVDLDYMAMWWPQALGR